MKWFDIWFEDAQSVIETMVRNMLADLEAGYNPNGGCILKQKADICDRKKMFADQMDLFKNMEDRAVNRWCYYDLKKRGVIA